MQWFMIHDALSEHTAHDHRWLVAGFEFASHSPGVNPPLQLDSWVVVIDQMSDLILHYCLFVVLKGWSLMSASRLLCVQGLWLLVCLWSVHW